MITRRALLAGGLAAGTATSVAASGDATPVGRATGVSDDSATLNSILSEVREIGNAVTPQGGDSVGLIRNARRTFIKNTSKFPDYIDVGLLVWEGVVDWLVYVQQPVTVTRLADGRYTLPLWGTTIVLRPDFPENFVGQGYDK
jgi:hypothetical protein